MIIAIETDISNNKGIFYCSPNFTISTRDLELIEVGIQTKGYEDLIKQSNLLINVGFIGKLTDSSTTQYRLNINGIISEMSSKGVKMIKPMAIDLEQFNGLDWNVNRNFRRKSILVPQENIMYKTIQGDYNLRFNNYQDTNVTIKSNPATTDD